MRAAAVRMALGACVLMIAMIAGAIWAGAAPRTRGVTGVVSDKRGNPLKGAAVQIENPVNLDVLSYITGNDGRYYFHQLNTDIDFKLTARYKRWWSKSKTLSKFDSKPQAVIDLEIPVE